MSKINIESSLKKNNIENISLKTQGILQDNKIKYKEDKVINILDIKEEILKRKSDNYHLIIDFKNQIIKTEYLDIKIRIIKKEIKQNKIKIKYKMIGAKDIFEYEIKWRIYEN